MQQRENSEVSILFQQLSRATEAMFHQMYREVHSKGLLSFLSTASDQWIALGEEGQDPFWGISTATATVT